LKKQCLPDLFSKILARTWRLGRQGNWNKTTETTTINPPRQFPKNCRGVFFLPETPLGEESGRVSPGKPD